MFTLKVRKKNWNKIHFYYENVVFSFEQFAYKAKFQWGGSECAKSIFNRIVMWVTIGCLQAE